MEYYQDSDVMTLLLPTVRDLLKTGYALNDPFDITTS